MNIKRFIVTRNHISGKYEIRDNQGDRAVMLDWKYENDALAICHRMNVEWQAQLVEMSGKVAYRKG